jgi:DNA-binding transcriptional ArsR family regulator
VPDCESDSSGVVSGGDSPLSWDTKAKFFKALGDETRLKIVSYLLDHECFACDFAALTQRDQTTVSRHLKVLVEAGILKFQKKGRHIIYSIRDSKVGKNLASFGMKGTNHSCCVDLIAKQDTEE